MAGGPGSDLLIDSAGPDTIDGGDGDDAIWISRARTVVDCGPGADVVFHPYYTPDGADESEASANAQLPLRTTGCERIVAKHLSQSRNPRWVDPGPIVAAARERALVRAGPEVRATLQAVYARDAGQPFQRYGDASEGPELLLANARNRQLARLGGVFGLGGDDRLEGLTGADLLDGGAGADGIYGRSGDDRLVGGDGDDVLEGARGEDRIRGGPGEDALNGGPDADLLDAGPGDDLVVSVDGTRDVVDCGPGHDTAVADRFDVLANCEGRAR